MATRLPVDVDVQEDLTPKLRAERVRVALLRRKIQLLEQRARVAKARISRTRIPTLPRAPAIPIGFRRPF